MKKILKLLLLLTLSSFSFSKDLYIASGIDDSSIKLSAKHYIFKSLYGSMETRLSNVEHSMSIGLGANINRFDISFYYTKGEGTYPVQDIAYTENDLRLKFILSKLIDSNLYVETESKSRFYGSASYSYFYINAGIHTKLNENFYIDALYQVNLLEAPTSSGNDVSLSLMLGYVYRY